MTKENKRWLVLKRVRLNSIDNTNGTERYVFKDEARRTYYVDRKDSGEICHSLILGNSILAWVVQESKAYGFIRTELNNMPINDFINTIPDLTIDDLYNGYGWKKLISYLGITVYLHDEDFCTEEEVELLPNMESMLQEDIGDFNEKKEILEGLAFVYNKLVKGNENE